jgi:hypothetical protein
MKLAMYISADAEFRWHMRQTEKAQKFHWDVIIPSLQFYV